MAVLAIPWHYNTAQVLDSSTNIVVQTLLYKYIAIIFVDEI